MKPDAKTRGSLGSYFATGDTTSRRSEKSGLHLSTDLEPSGVKSAAAAGAAKRKGTTMASSTLSFMLRMGRSRLCLNVLMSAWLTGCKQI